MSNSESHKFLTIVKAVEEMVRENLLSDEHDLTDGPVGEYPSYSVGFVEDVPLSRTNQHQTNSLTLSIQCFYDSDEPLDDWAIDRKKIEDLIFKDCTLGGLTTGADSAGSQAQGSETQTERTITAYVMVFVFEYRVRII